MLKYWNYDIVFAEIPDEVTLAINLTCCPNRCKGCHSSYLQDDIGNVLDVEELNHLVDLYKDSITCVCFMGGDADTETLTSLAEHILLNYEGICVAWYSGRQQLPEGFHILPFRYIKLGPYIEELGPLKSVTTNQRLFKIIDGKMMDITSRLQKK